MINESKMDLQSSEYFENGFEGEDEKKILPGLLFPDHNISAHKERRKIKCSQCEYKTNMRRSLKRHIQSVHEGMKYPCDQCDKQFSNQQNRKKHIQSVHESVKYP